LKSIKFNKKIISDICNIGCTASDLTFCLQKTYGAIDEDIIFDLRVIVNEMLQNAIMHGNGGATNKYVRIVAGITNNEDAFVLVEDEGEGFNYKHVIKKNSRLRAIDNLNDEKECGRGILLVTSLSDKTKFNKRGNKILIYKKLMRKKDDIAT